MEQVTTPEYFNKEELIYWIDKQFVQETAQARIGRSLNDEELDDLTKLVENGLWNVVYNTVKTAIDEVSGKNE